MRAETKTEHFLVRAKRRLTREVRRVKKWNTETGYW